MLILVFILPLLAALLCLALNQVVATRWLGAGASAVMLLGGGALLYARLRTGLPLPLYEHTWIAVEQQTIAVALVLDQANWALALLALAGGGMALLALALALPRNLRGFGGLFAAAELALLAVTAGLVDQNMLFLPFLWATAALMSFLALRSSGALSSSDAPTVVLLAGLWGGLVLLGAALLVAAARSGAMSLQVVLAFWVVFGSLALGGPPFHTLFHNLADAPAALAGALLPLGLPLVGGYALIRFFAGLGGPPTPGWRLALMLLGLAMLLACAAGAAAATGLRRLIGWQLSAQMGLLLVAVGQGGAALAASAPALLAGGVTATLACYLAAAILERRAGTDALAEIALREPLLLPGAVFLIGAAAAVGLPGTWGFWPRLWLIDELLRAAPWAVAPLLTGSALLAATYVAPLAAFLRAGAPPADELAPARGYPLGSLITAAAVAAPLVVLGVLPELGWDAWLAPAQGAPGRATPAPRLPGAAGTAACAVAALGLIALPALARGRRRPPAERQGVLLPQALGESLAWLVWVAAPESSFARLWGALLRASGALRRWLSFFEQRYYLAGLLIAVIIVIMLFIQ